MAETEVVAAAPSGLVVGALPATGTRFAWRSPRLAVGAAILFALYLGGLLARVAVGRGDTRIFAFDPSLSPSADHLLGTDASGRDVLASLVYATAPTFELALLAGVVGTVVGVAAGLVSGYLRGAADTVLRGVSDVMLGMPAFALLIVVAAIMGRLSLVSLALVIALFSWPAVARPIRAQVLSLREQPFVTMSRLSNQGSAAIMAIELLPNMLALVAAMFVGTTTGALAMAIGLELIGLGPVDTQTLGLLLQNALSRGALSDGLWWCWLPAAAILVLFFLGLFVVSLAVDHMSNPRMPRAADDG
jgi:peptide/nickel transport system permease protein